MPPGIAASQGQSNPRTDFPAFFFRYVFENENLFASLPQTIVHNLKERMKCTQCSEGFSRDRSVFLPPCSHPVCSQCRRQVNKRYECRKCQKEFDVTSDFFQAFHKLNKIYENLETVDGFRCRNCNQLHPYWNTVECTQCSTKAIYYSCVWCAFKEHRTHGCELLDQTLPGRKASTRMSKTESLCSLDSYCCKDAMFLLYCARETKLFDRQSDETKTVNKMEVLKNPSAFFMGCGHLVNRNLWRRDLKEIPSNVLCKFCNSIEPILPTRRHFFDLTMMLNEMIGDRGTFNKRCETCKRKHPKDNFGKDEHTDKESKNCVWCSIEYKKGLDEATKGDMH